MAVYTIETWLRGMVDFDIPDATIMAILFNNEVKEGMSAASVSEEKRDLCLADLLMWLASSSISTSGESISDGGWSHQKSAKRVSDRAGLVKRAQELYAKWNSDKAKAAVAEKIIIKGIYT